MTAAIDEEFACSCLKAALEACQKHRQPQVEKYFERFLDLLGEHKLNEPLPKALQEHADSVQFHKAYPTDAIPLDLIALSNCLFWHDRPMQAEAGIQRVLLLIDVDEKLFFLRQNVYQEAARYFFEHENYAQAEALFSKQLSIVKAKGSVVLLNYVTINRLINLSGLHTANLQFLQAENCLTQALLLVETSPEKHNEQISSLLTSWKKLEQKAKKKTS